MAINRTEITTPFGSQGIRPSVLSNFTDFVDKGFSYTWDIAKYTIKPLYFKEWLDRYGLHVTGRRAGAFDSLLNSTLCYFITCIKIAASGSSLDLRDELQGIAVPTFMQDAHAAFPQGGIFRSQPFEFKFVFDKIWTSVFKSNPDYFKNLLLRTSRKYLEDSFPVVPLDFNVFYNQVNNMVTQETKNRGVPQMLEISKDTHSWTINEQTVTTDIVDKVTIRYGDDSQLAYNWQTTYFNWFSITCDKFDDLYKALPKEYSLSRRDLLGFLGNAVSWYIGTRGGASSVPNFGGSSNSSGPPGSVTGGPGGPGGSNPPIGPGPTGNNPQGPKGKTPPLSPKSKQAPPQPKAKQSPPQPVTTPPPMPHSTPPPQPKGSSVLPGNGNYSPDYLGNVLLDLV